VIQLKIWITTVGWSPFAVINTIWAACFFKDENFVPEKIVLLHNGHANKTIAENVNIVKKWLDKILLYYDVIEPCYEEIPIDEEDINAYCNTYTTLLNTYKNNEKNLSEQKTQIAIDITPGRKFMSSIAMACGLKYKTYVHKLYYLHLENSKYFDIPFIKIPFSIQNLINLMELL